MMTLVYVIATALVAALIYLGIRFYLGIRLFVRNSERFGGPQIIICPETGKQAVVEVDARRAALTSLIGQTDIRLESCWRWPLNRDCGQECLLPLRMLMKWYRGKNCAFCERPFEEIDLIDHQLAVLNPEGVTVEWAAIPISAANETMATGRPVCWKCYFAQKFRRERRRSRK